MAKPKYILLNTVGSGTWTVPTDWNSDNNTIHMIGGGGGGFASGWRGGGGGGYTKVVNYNLAPGSSVSYSVGAGGGRGDANVYGTPYAGGTTTFGAYSADGGKGLIFGSSTHGLGGVGGTSNGGNGNNYGGGGAGGPYGNGAVSSFNNIGGAGDAGFGGVATVFNGPAVAGFEIYPGVAGSGSGGGSNDGSANNGGLYGGGGGGIYTGNFGGYGAQGVIIIMYTPASHFTSPDGDLEDIFINDYAMIDQYAMTGSLWMWGTGSNGRLGDNTITNKSSPVQTIAGGTNWKQVSGSNSHTAAVKTDGTLWTWGNNAQGQLGNNTLISRSNPVQTISGGTNWKQVACGQTHTAAIKTDGTLWTWGYNAQGQLGNNTLISRSSPVQTVAGGTNWKQVACGGNYMAAVKTDATLWLWGYNNTGQLGDNTTTDRSSPVQTVVGGTWKYVSTGSQHAAAIKTDGTLWLWGRNQYGQLGNNSSGTIVSSPVQTIAAGTNWKQVSAQSEMTAAIKTDGTLWTWGQNVFGQLGDNTTTNRSSPVQTVSGGTNWKQVACGEFTAAIKTDGTLWTWGLNSSGRLGDNTTTNRSSPVQTVSGGTNWKAIDSTGYGSGGTAIHFYDAGNLYPSA